MNANITYDLNKNVLVIQMGNPSGKVAPDGTVILDVFEVDLKDVRKAEAAAV